MVVCGADHRSAGSLDLLPIHLFNHSLRPTDHSLCVVRGPCTERLPCLVPNMYYTHDPICYTSLHYSGLGRVLLLMMTPPSLSIERLPDHGFIMKRSQRSRWPFIKSTNTGRHIHQQPLRKKRAVDVATDGRRTRICIISKKHTHDIVTRN